MSYVFKQNLLASSKYAIKSPYAMTAQYITVHNTANDASAENEIRYMLSNSNQVSYHVAVDDKQVIQAIPFNRNAWHCGDGQGNGNRKSIGIEICYSKSGGSRYVAAEENAVQYIAQLLKQFGWGIDRVKKHQDWNGKYCPHRILDEGRWSSFLKRIELAMKQTAPTPIKPTTPPKEEANVMELLNATGRVEAKALIKKAVACGLFQQSHLAKLDTYTDADLISYAIAYVSRTAK